MENTIMAAVGEYPQCQPAYRAWQTAPENKQGDTSWTLIGTAKALQWVKQRTATTILTRRRSPRVSDDEEQNQPLPAADCLNLRRLLVTVRHLNYFPKTQKNSPL